jgi:tetratricopeptide (TPR) repeat protein
MKSEDWLELESFSTSFLEQTKGHSFKGFFYLGISFYKMQDYENAIRALQKAELVDPNDSQL